MKAQDLSIVLECMKFILEGNQIEDFEFSSRIGVESPTLAKVIERLREIHNVDAETALCINNCLNEVCYGLRVSDADWNSWFTNPKDELRETYRRWAREEPTKR